MQTGLPLSARIVVITMKVLLALVACLLGFGLLVGIVEAGAIDGFMAH